MKTDELEVATERIEAAETVLQSSKIETQHLARLAIVYVRQSNARQVRENVESTQLQYSLARLAKAYGWPSDQIEIIDDDLGVSGKSLEGRTGFQRLLAEISLGHVGIVMGIEMSRLARNCRDWHQLLELCAVFGALLGDTDGVYNPCEYNDRLLLGLKGTMSEAELHILQGRLDAGRKSKARRGEHFSEVPIGYVRTRENVAFEPDEQARNVVRLLFDKFDELGSAHAVLQYFRQHRIRIGIRKNNGPHPEELTWRPVNRSTILYILHHPMYAGAYVFGRHKSVSTGSADGAHKTIKRKASRHEWQVLIRDKIPAYITWEQWERNQKKLEENSTKFGFGVSRGSSLLAGRVVCGKCGSRMSVHYRDANPYFACNTARIQKGAAICQSFNGSWLESLVSQLVLQALEPAAVQISVKAADSIEEERKRLETHHCQSIERAKYKANLARRRFEEVDPANRLVAAELERTWEASLQIQRRSEEALNRFRQESPSKLTAEQRASIEALARDFRSLWQSESTTNADRQDLVRTLIDAIVVEVVNGTERLSITIHWSGGFTSEHETRRPVQSIEQLESSDSLVNRVQQLYNAGYPLSELARKLNGEGFKPAKNECFTKTSIGALCRMLRRKGLIKTKPSIPQNYWRAGELTDELGIGKPTLSGWRRRSWVQARRLGNRWVYWADSAEIKRLRKLKSHPPSGSTPMPTELTIPASVMPADPAHQP